MTVAIQENQKAVTFESVQVPGLTGATMSGLALIILAFSKNYESIQNYNTHQMDLAAALQEKQAKEAHAAIREMEDGPIAELRRILAAPYEAHEAAALIANETAKLNVMNTAYNQKNTYYSGLIQGVNQNSSDTVQTLSTDLNMMGTNGVLATIQTITQCLG